MFEQAVLPIQDELRFAEVKRTLEPLFDSAHVADFLRRVQRSQLRIRDFEGLLKRGLLGATIGQDYAALATSDRGQVRELYLRMVEQVAPELRAKFLRIYAYY